MALSFVHKLHLKRIMYFRFHLDLPLIEKLTFSVMPYGSSIQLCDIITRLVVFLKDEVSSVNTDQAVKITAEIQLKAYKQVRKQPTS